MNAIEMTARHFARQSGVSVVFRENARPAACPGKNLIIFPCNLAEQSRTTALVWLLHESAHLRWSEPVDLGGRGFLQPFLNALEDVRVDHKVFTEYPAVKEALYREYVAEVLSDPTRWQSPDKVTAFLVATVAKGLGFEDILPQSVEALGFVRDHSAELDKILSAASSGRDTRALLPLAAELAGLVLGPKALEQITRAMGACAAARAALEQLAEEREQLHRTSRSLARRIRNRRKRMDLLAGPEDTPRRNLVRRQIAKSYAFRRVTRNARNDLDKRARDTWRTLAKAEKVLAGPGGNTAASAARVPDLFSLDASALEFEASRPLGVQFERVLGEKLSETARYLEAGSTRIVPKRLHAAFTHPSRVLGASRHRVARWKRLFFLLDASSSMRGEKAGMLCEGVTRLAASLDRCRKAVGRLARFEYEIWVFNDEIRRIKGPDDQFNERTLGSYSARGGTDLALALAQMHKAMLVGSKGLRRNVLFCLTDAQIREEDVLVADSFQTGQVVYIGIGAEDDADMSLEARSIHRHLFLRHNILDRNMLESVLQQAIIEEVTR